MDFFKTLLEPIARRFIEQFCRDALKARIVEIPGGQQYCLIKQEEIALLAIKMFLCRYYCVA
jgi:hypothetical protein